MVIKKIAVLFFCLLLFVAKAQKNNEVRFDVFDLLALKTLDLSYEYHVNSESSIGVAFLFNFEDSASFRYNEDFMFTSYYRHHLFDKKNINFFGELFGVLNKGTRKLPEEDVSTEESKSYIDFAFGLSFGAKYVSKHGFVLEVHTGFARNLFNTDLSRDIVSRVGISVGKQF